MPERIFEDLVYRLLELFWGVRGLAFRMTPAGPSDQKLTDHDKPLLPCLLFQVASRDNVMEEHHLRKSFLLLSFLRRLIQQYSSLLQVFSSIFLRLNRILLGRHWSLVPGCSMILGSFLSDSLAWYLIDFVLRCPECQALLWQLHSWTRWVWWWAQCSLSGGAGGGP